MKPTIKQLWGALLLMPLLWACHEETPGDASDLAAETIVVSGAEGYRKQTFAEGARIITDRAYKVTNVPDYFNGFEMLTSKGKANNGGTITTRMDGLVYIVAPASAKPQGWAVVPNTIYQDRDMMYATADQEVKLSVYMKRAYAGKPVEIPQVTTFASAVPIARKIVYDVPEEPLATSSVQGTVRCNGTPVKDVVVSDGELTTTTDENGKYVLHSWKRTGYVFISVPSGYEVPADGLIPRNFVRLDGADEEVADFELTEAENDEFTLFVMNDIHLSNTKETDDVQRFRKEFAPDYAAMLAQTPGKVYATVLGDMTTDTRWYRNNFALPEYLGEMERVAGAIPIWHVMGNHDNDIRCSGPSEVWDALAVETYRRVIGPNYYSFNLGQWHFVVLDDIVYTGANAYNTYVEDVQLGWLEKDLSHVDAATPVVVMTHAPLYRYSGMADGVLLANKNFSNPDQVDWLLEKFAKFEQVHIMSGHTHTNYYCKISDRITEHNNISVSGSSWQIRPQYGACGLRRQCREQPAAGERIQLGPGVDGQGPRKRNRNPGGSELALRPALFAGGRGRDGAEQRLFAGNGRAAHVRGDGLGTRQQCGSGGDRRRGQQMDADGSPAESLYVGHAITARSRFRAGVPIRKLAREPAP